MVSELAVELDAPLLVGTVEDAGTEHFRNSVQLFDADGEYVDRYDKVHRVPFGEWVPLRWLLEPIAGDALPERDAVTGTSSNLLDVPGPVGEVVTPISWEIFFPDRTREGVERGARLVLNPTNGSSFTGTIVQTQQVAASRMRAIESGRWVAQVAPTGFTALIDDEGRVVERSAISEQSRDPRRGPPPRGPHDLHPPRQPPRAALGSPSSSPAGLRASRSIVAVTSTASRNARSWLTSRRVPS